MLDGSLESEYGVGLEVWKGPGQLISGGLPGQWTTNNPGRKGSKTRTFSALSAFQKSIRSSRIAAFLHSEFSSPDLAPRKSSPIAEPLDAINPIFPPKLYQQVPSNRILLLHNNVIAEHNNARRTSQKCSPSLCRTSSHNTTTRQSEIAHYTGSTMHDHSSAYSLTTGRSLYEPFENSLLHLEPPTELSPDAENNMTPTVTATDNTMRPSVTRTENNKPPSPTGTDNATSAPSSFIEHGARSGFTISLRSSTGWKPTSDTHLLDAEVKIIPDYRSVEIGSKTIMWVAIEVTGILRSMSTKPGGEAEGPDFGPEEIRQQKISECQGHLRTYYNTI
jgi:hypothetical protein